MVFCGDKVSALIVLASILIGMGKNPIRAVQWSFSSMGSDLYHHPKRGICKSRLGWFIALSFDFVHLIRFRMV